VERRTLCIWKQRGCKKNNVVVCSVKSREEGREFTEVRNEEGKLCFFLDPVFSLPTPP
jgi:hypothetical protein